MSMATDPAICPLPSALPSICLHVISCVARQSAQKKGSPTADELKNNNPESKVVINGEGSREEGIPSLEVAPLCKGVPINNAGIKPITSQVAAGRKE